MSIRQDVSVTFILKRLESQIQLIGKGAKNNLFFASDLQQLDAYGEERHNCVLARSLLK